MSPGEINQVSSCPEEIGARRKQAEKLKTTLTLKRLPLPPFTCGFDFNFVLLCGFNSLWAFLGLLIISLLAQFNYLPVAKTVVEEDNRKAVPTGWVEGGFVAGREGAAVEGLGPFSAHGEGENQK